MLVSYIISSTTALVMYYPHSSTNQKDKCWYMDSYVCLLRNRDKERLIIHMLKSRSKQNVYLAQIAYYFWQDVYTSLQKKQLESHIFVFKSNIPCINLDWAKGGPVGGYNIEQPSITDRRRWIKDGSFHIFFQCLSLFSRNDLITKCLQDHDIHGTHRNPLLPAFLWVVMML